MTTPKQDLSPQAAAFAAEQEAAFDKVYREVAYLVMAEDRCSLAWIQRTFTVGREKAARIIEKLEAEGVVSKPDAKGKRKIWGQGADRSAEMAPPEPAADDAAGAPHPGARLTIDVKVADRSASNGAFSVTADELRQFIEQFEHLAVEKSEINDQQKAVMAEAKARGYDTKVIKRIIALRKRDMNDVAEENAIFETYCAAMGISL